MSDPVFDAAALAQALHGQTIPHWSDKWSDIGRLQRLGLVRLEAVSRWSACVRCANVQLAPARGLEPQSITVVATGEN